MRIPDQAARTLAALLESPGIPVTREQLRSYLWPEGEVLDYDRSINRAISELRSVLQHRSLKSANLIETLPKRGYCFVAPVCEIEEPSATVEGNTEPPVPTAQRELLPIPKLQSSLSAEPAEPIPLAPSPREARSTARHLGWAVALLLAVGVGAGASAVWKARQIVKPPVSIGIADFDTDGAEVTSLAESFRLNLADTMTQSPLLDVRSVHSFHYSETEENAVLERARKLGIELMLFGDLKLENDRWNMHMELVRAKDGAHLGSLQYSGNKAELPSLPDRVEQNLFERLRLDKTGMQQIAEHTVSVAAYTALLRARTLFNQRTNESLLEAVQAYQEAIRIDGNYARAYSGLAHTYFVLSQHGVRDEARYVEQARDASTIALRLNPGDAEAHGVLGLSLLLKDFDFDGAQRHITRALELDPNHSVYRQWLAILYGEECDFQRGLAEIDKIQAADPEWALASITEIYLAGSARQFARADRAANRLLTHIPNWAPVHEQAALLYWDEGKHLQAISEWRRAAELKGDTARVQAEDRGAEVFRKGGVPAYAKVRLETIQSDKSTYISMDSSVPEWRAYAGDYNKALDGLEEIVRAHKPYSLQIAAAPAYAPLHGNPRFQALLYKIYGDRAAKLIYR